jgi:hypothetical protein
MNHNRQLYFEITNTSDKVKEVHLFGYSKHLHSLNFGNDTHIRLDAKYNSYLQSLVESAFSPCKIEHMRIASSTDKNIEQIVHVISEDGFGCTTTIPIHFKVGEYQFQKDMSEAKTSFRLDYNTSLKFKIQPSSSIHVYLWGDKLDKVDYMPPLNPTLSQIAKLFFRKLFKLK